MLFTLNIKTILYITVIWGHFSWVFTVCQSTHLGVTSIQSVNSAYITIIEMAVNLAI